MVSRIPDVMKGGGVLLNFRRYLNNEKGFTMIEMMVVLIIIAVLIGVGVKFYTGYIDKARITKAKADITTMQAALDSYYAENSEYPDVASAADAGLSPDVVGSGKKYGYSVGINNKSYSLYTNEKVDRDNYVVGTGENGRSNPPITTNTTNVQ
ncbi:MAG TPA: hypothetical protein DCE07_08880 [Peptococcaceae bacterium]|nr:hypothetical protein [Peptococcaceae bacterium]